MKINKILGIVLIILISIFVVTWLTRKIPLLSPLNENYLVQFLPSYEKDTQGKKVIYGFAPFWYLEKLTLQPELTHLAYFSLTIDPEGNFLTKTDQGGEPGFVKISSDTLLELNDQLKEDQQQKRRLDLVVTQLKNDDIEAFLNNPEAQKNFLKSLDSVLLAYPFDGINLDIEYAGETSSSLRKKMTEFVKLTRLHLNQRRVASGQKSIELSIDMYAAAATKNMIWDVSKIAPYVDYVVIMAYDFHRSSSSVAGPIAPLFDTNQEWKESINTYLKKFTKKMPSEKILLGVPFYGYEWQTTERKLGSLTYPGSGSTASYKRVLEILENKDELDIQEHWSEASLSPFITYTKNDQNYTITYENTRSLSYKLEYVNQLNLGGIAIWSLGYEGNNRDLWNVIKEKIGD